jgi:hypothetical protein
MGTTPELDTTILVPFIIVMLVLALIMWLAMLGGSLKLSFVMLSHDPPSYLRCLVAAVLLLVVNIGVFFAIAAALGPQPWYISTAYQFFVQAVVTSLIVKRNPIISVAATFLHSLFSGLGTAAIALTIIVMTGSALSGLQERGSLFFAQAKESMSGNHANDSSVANVNHIPEATPVSIPLPVSVSGAKPGTPAKSAAGVASNPFIK